MAGFWLWLSQNILHSFDSDGMHSECIRPIDAIKYIHQYLTHSNQGFNTISEIVLAVCKIANPSTLANVFVCLKIAFQINI